MRTRREGRQRWWQEWQGGAEQLAHGIQALLMELMQNTHALGAVDSSGAFDSILRGELFMFAHEVIDGISHPMADLAYGPGPSEALLLLGRGRAARRGRG